MNLNEQDTNKAGNRDLIVHRITKSFGTAIAVDDVSFSVREGSFVSLLGPSGSGKTTLLMLIAGFEEPNTGSIHLGGRDLVGVPPERRNFGMVFQGYALFPHFTVAENVAFPLRVRHVGHAEQRRRVAHALDLVELRGYEDRKPHQISGGQQQRVALARALVFEPNMLLLDEPLSALDKKLRSSLQVELRELQRRIEKTFLCVTHDQEEALSMSDEIAILRAGKLVQIGAPQVLFERPHSYFVADFLGESNFIEGRVISFSDNVLEYAAGTMTFGQTSAGNPGTSKILLGIRPTRIALSHHEPTETNRLQGTVASCQYRGNEVQYIVETSLGRLSIIQPTWHSESASSVGEIVWLHWDTDAAQIVADDRTV